MNAKDKRIAALEAQLNAALDRIEQLEAKVVTLSSQNLRLHS